MFEDTEEIIALSGDGSNEKRYGFDAVARCRCHSKSKKIMYINCLSQPALWHYSFKRISTTSRFMRRSYGIN
jgi:hypothetical protein